MTVQLNLNLSKETLSRTVLDIRVCRNSLKDKTCPYKECRFFHLKGTKTVKRNIGLNISKSNDPNWRENKQRSTGAGPGQKQNNTRQNTGPKNGQTGLSQKSKKIKGPYTNWKTEKSPDSKQKPKEETVTQKEKKQLGQTLEAIMKRLDKMESRTAYYAHPGVQLRPLPRFNHFLAQRSHSRELRHSSNGEAPCNGPKQHPSNWIKQDKPEK